MYKQCITKAGNKSSDSRGNDFKEEGLDYRPLCCISVHWIGLRCYVWKLVLIEDMHYVLEPMYFHHFPFKNIRWIY